MRNLWIGILTLPFVSCLTLLSVFMGRIKSAYSTRVREVQRDDVPGTVNTGPGTESSSHGGRVGEGVQ